MDKFAIHNIDPGFQFNPKASNGQIAGVSERHTVKADCENSIDSMQKNAADAAIALAE